MSKEKDLGKLVIESCRNHKCEQKVDIAYSSYIEHTEELGKGVDRELLSKVNTAYSGYKLWLYANKEFI